MDCLMISCLISASAFSAFFAWPAAIPNASTITTKTHYPFHCGRIVPLRSASVTIEHRYQFRKGNVLAGPQTPGLETQMHFFLFGGWTDSEKRDPSLFTARTSGAGNVRQTQTRFRTWLPG